jgi:DNA polymerase III subunit epsilon
MKSDRILDTRLSETEFSVIDVETTGLSARTNNIIEIGIVKIKNLKITDKYTSLINPGSDIPSFITQLTGITNRDVKSAPTFDLVAEDIKDFISDSVISGHNFSFDESFLNAEMIRNDRTTFENQKVCTLKIARKLFPGLRSKSLSSVASFLKISNKNAHRALGDALTTAKVLIKQIKKLSDEAGIETVEDLIKYQSYSFNSFSKNKIKPQLQEVVFSCPNLPGVYFFINKKNQIIYVGKAKSLNDRLKSYFSPSAARKAKKIVRQAVRIKYFTTNSELTALLTEAETIKKIKPRLNSQLKKYGNKYFLKVDKNHAFPSIDIANNFDFDGNDYFGLYLSRKKAEAVKEIVDRTFAIRECTDKEFNKKRKCFLADIERCTVPCEIPDSERYKNELEEVYKFLKGENQSAVNRLLNKMKEYSASQKYEKAGEIKTIVDLILRQVHQTSLLAEPVNDACVVIEISERFSKDYIALISGRMVIKSYLVDGKNDFDSFLDDYFSYTIQTNYLPTEEDLEKLKISLNWLIKNRNKVRIFYLKDYSSINDLYAAISNNNLVQLKPDEGYFDIKTLSDKFSEIETV